jgi:DNA-binding XRE family transcriptional regulator
MEKKIEGLIRAARERRAVRVRYLPRPVERSLIRHTAGLSQASIARAIGVTSAAVGEYERGTAEPGYEVRSRYAALLLRLAEDVLEESIRRLKEEVAV